MKPRSEPRPASPSCGRRSRACNRPLSLTRPLPGSHCRARLRLPPEAPDLEGACAVPAPQSPERLRRDLAESATAPPAGRARTPRARGRSQRAASRAPPRFLPGGSSATAFNVVAWGWNGYTCRNLVGQANRRGRVGQRELRLCPIGQMVHPSSPRRTYPRRFLVDDRPHPRRHCSQHACQVVARIPHPNAPPHERKRHNSTIAAAANRHRDGATIETIQLRSGGRCATRIPARIAATNGGAAL